MKPKVDLNKCTGCGTCEAICPAVFKLGENGKAHIIPNANCETADCCKEAKESCPAEAISL